jgi:hypothetical protein
MPTNPVVDPIGCGSEIAHGALPTFPPPVPGPKIMMRFLPSLIGRLVKKSFHTCDMRHRLVAASGQLYPRAGQPLIGQCPVLNLQLQAPLRSGALSSYRGALRAPRMPRPAAARALFEASGY